MIEIVPVMDIMNGLVVHAVAGKRNEYRPLYKSTISCSPKPEDVLYGFKKLSCKYVYIADLDAILSKGNNGHVIDIALSYGFNVLADVGRRGLDKVDRENISYVLGTEYIVYPDELDRLSNRVVSLDIKGGKVIFRNGEVDITQVTKSICDQNAKMIIIINLDLVGTLCGIDMNTLNVVRHICKTDIAVGGGLKSVDELKMLKELGVRYALVATAIHKGIINQCRY